VTRLWTHHLRQTLLFTRRRRRRTPPPRRRHRGDHKPVRCCARAGGHSNGQDIGARGRGGRGGRARRGTELAPHAVWGDLDGPPRRSRWTDRPTCRPPPRSCRRRTAAPHAPWGAHVPGLAATLTDAPRRPSGSAGGRQPRPHRACAAPHEGGGTWQRSLPRGKGGAQQGGCWTD